jgi:hypothetical protein
MSVQNNLGMLECMKPQTNIAREGMMLFEFTNSLVMFAHASLALVGAISGLAMAGA